MVTEKTLSLQLKELESDGLVIIRTVDTSKPPLKVIYELTDLGAKPQAAVACNLGMG